MRPVRPVVMKVADKHAHTETDKDMATDESADFPKTDKTPKTKRPCYRKNLEHLTPCPRDHSDWSSDEKQRPSTRSAA